MIHIFTRCSINGATLKVFEDGRIFIWKKWSWTAKEEKWYELKGCIEIQKSGYKQHRTYIKGKTYSTSRIIWKAFHPEFDIEDISPNNTIDHISRNSLNNHISNLRTADRKIQSQNRGCVIHQQGYSYDITKKKFVAYMWLNGKQKKLGAFNTADEAKYCFEQAKLGNIPKLKEVKGYTFHKQTKKYHAYINFNHVRTQLGSFETESEARQAYLNAKHLGN